ncbi:NACHT domain-containing protein [Cladophialophora immunda]|nr:NACHT domain-containing protein [Cladophialophora immunda]
MDDKDTELKQLWEEAVAEYASRSKRGTISEKWKTSVKTDFDLDKLIEQHESDFSRFRNSRGKFWGLFMSTMRQLQKLGRVAQAAIDLTPSAPASVIVEAGLFLINSASAVADTYDSLEGLFKRIRDITDRLDEYLTGNIDRKLRKVVIKLLCSLLDVFCEAEAAIGRGRGKEMMRRVVGKANKIQTALDQLDEMVRAEVALVTAKTYATTQRIDERAEADRDRELLRETLCADIARDNEAFGKDVESSRLKQSGYWLLKEKLYDKWVRMEFPVLSILGKPGTGKTYLASRVISHLQQSDGIATYFYIREGMNTHHTPEVILKTIAYQITRLDDAYHKLAVAICRSDKSLLSQDSIWKSLLLKPFEVDTSRPLFIVIDGVDEATPRNQELLVKMARNLSDLRSSNRSNLPAIQLLLLGRPDLDYNISNAWRGEGSRPKIIHVEPSLSKADIEIFIKKAVKEDIPLLHRMPQGRANRLRIHIIKSLGDSADGMFMLAKLMVAEIKDMNKPELIREALAKPPQGLDDMFKRVITRLTVMGGFDKKDLNELIMWVACAKRDLLLGELDLVLKLRDLRQNGIVGLEDELKMRFGSFFSLSYPEADPSDQQDDASVTGDQSAPSVSGQSKELEAEVDAASDPWSEIGNDANNSEAEDNDDDDDDDDDAIAPPRFFEATVKFGHASIGQHFRSAPLHEGIGMDLNLAQAHIAMTCLLFLTGNIQTRKGRPWRKPDLFKYSANHFLDHLAEVKLEALKSLHPDVFKKLSEETLLLFRAGSCLARGFEFVRDKHKFMCQLFSQDTLSRLREYLPEPTNSIVGSRTSDLEWLQKAKASSEFLLQQSAHSIAEAWLRCDSSRKQWTLAPNRPFEHITESISPDDIRQLASLVGLERTSDWHFALGSTFRRIDTPQHLLAAADEFRHAIRKSHDPNDNWKLYLEEASALFYLEKYDEAIVAASNARESLPAVQIYRRAELFQMILVANLHLGNEEAAVTAAAESWSVAPDSPDAAANLIYIYNKTGRFSETVNIVRSFLSPENTQWGPEFLCDVMKMERAAIVSELISIACAKTGQLDLAHDAFTAAASQAAKAGDRSRRAVADAALAQLWFRFYGSDEKAIELWENILKDHSGTPAALKASFELAPLYLTKATDPERVDADSWVLRLKQLAELVGCLELTNPGVKTFPYPDEASALMGRWYAQQGEIDLARTAILPLVKRSIRDLTDRDNSNDHRAYWNLARALTSFGDRANAAIAYAFTMPLQKSKKLQEFEASLDATRPLANTEPDAPFNFQSSCDGRCSRLPVDFRSFSACEICVDIEFCDECRQKHIDGTLAFRICDPRHPLFEIYPPKGLVTKGAEGYKVRLDDGLVVSADDWLGMISREWIGA